MVIINFCCYGINEYICSGMIICKYSDIEKYFGKSIFKIYIRFYCIKVI